MNKKILFLLSLMSIVFISFVRASPFCYQEFANATSSCGGLATGNYSYDNIVNPENASDGDYSTRSVAGESGLCDRGYFYVNYTKATNAQNISFWQVKDGDTGATQDLINISIPAECWNYDATKLVFQSYVYTGTCSPNTIWSCYNGTGWSNICDRTNNNLCPHAGGVIYEEAMFWGLPVSYRTPIANNTKPGINETVTFNTYWESSSNLTNITFSTNCTGIWINNSLNYPVCYIDNRNNNTCSVPYYGINSNTTNSGRTEADGDWNSCQNWHSMSGSTLEQLSWYMPNSLTDGTLSVLGDIYYNFSIPLVCLNSTTRFTLLEVISNLTGIPYNIFTCKLANNTLVQIGNYSANTICEAGIYFNQRNSVFNATYNLTMTDIKNKSSYQWYYFSTDTYGSSNVTLFQTIYLIHQKPVATVSILNKPILSTQWINATIAFIDVDNDTWTANETKWYQNGVYLPLYDNLTKLSPGNASLTGTYTFSARVYDVFNVSDWQNDSVVINDNTPPVFSNFTVDTPITVNNVGYTYAYCYDISSGIASLNMTIIDPVGTAFTASANVYNGSIYRGGFAYNTIGTYIFNASTCCDNSGNCISNNSINISISVVSTPVSPGTGGGSSSSTSECKLTLYRPIAGSTMTLYARTGQVTQPLTFDIKNTGQAQGDYRFEITGNEYLKGNCKLNVTSKVILPDQTFTNTIYCVAPNLQQEGNIVVTGCTQTGTYKVVIGNNWFSGLFQSILLGQGNFVIGGLVLAPIVLVLGVIAILIILPVVVLIIRKMTHG